MISIEIPVYLKTNQLGYSFISELYHSVSSQKDKDLIINFSKCQLADGNIAAALGAILDKLLTYGFSIKLSNPSVKQVRKVFSRNHFFAHGR